MSRRRAAGPSGVLVVDKPRGVTSHDVVRALRRALGTRAVGHAGTLDPMATGTLVVAFGRATKLVAYLTAADKTYDAVLRLGEATDSLDADGVVTERADVPGALALDQVQAIADQFLGPHLQRAPAVSAIKAGGVRPHERARRGELVVPPMRPVVLHRVKIHGVDENPGVAEVRLTLSAAKGFYVRSFGAELAERLGTVGHLTALRRIASGRFHVDDSLTMPEVEGADREHLLRSSLSLADAWPLGRARVSSSGERKVAVGQRVPPEEWTLEGTEGAEPSSGGGPFAVLAPTGEMVAIAACEDRELVVLRGIPLR